MSAGRLDLRRYLLCNKEWFPAIVDLGAAKMVRFVALRGIVGEEWRARRRAVLAGALAVARRRAVRRSCGASKTSMSPSWRRCGRRSTPRARSAARSRSATGASSASSGAATATPCRRSATGALRTWPATGASTRPAATPRGATTSRAARPRSSSGPEICLFGLYRPLRVSESTVTVGHGPHYVTSVQRSRRVHFPGRLSNSPRTPPRSKRIHLPEKKQTFSYPCRMTSTFKGRNSPSRGGEIGKPRVRRVADSPRDRRHRRVRGVPPRTPRSSRCS